MRLQFKTVDSECGWTSSNQLEGHNLKQRLTSPEAEFASWLPLELNCNVDSSLGLQAVRPATPQILDLPVQINNVTDIHMYLYPSYWFCFSAES